ncbi:unnamed protein product [Diamesa tonsa]
MTTRRLRTVTNCFVMSLAVADWLVGIFVLPPAVFVFIVGSWPLGWILCDIWISLDVLLCTASILSLCAISIDRYLAVTQPLNYSKRRRSKRLAMLMILIVWILALAITCPPFLGWYDQERRNSDMTDCRYNQNKGYVVFSAMGSFFIPCCVMLYVYSKICCVLTSRQSRLTRTEACERSVDLDNEYITSEFDTSYHNYSVSKDLTSTVNGSSSQPPPQTTLYELLEYAKSRSILKNSQHNNSNNSTYIIRSMNSVQFNQLTSNDNLSTTSAKTNRIASKIPIRISSLKRETKTAQTLSMVVGGFIACWLPFFIVYLLIPFLDKNAISDNWQEFLTWLGWMNSAVNPFIYAFYNVDFRIAFWRLTFRNCCHNHHNVVL